MPLNEKVEFLADRSRQNDLVFRHAVHSAIRGVPWTFVNEFRVDALSLVSGQMNATAKLRTMIAESRAHIDRQIAAKAAAEANGDGGVVTP